MINLKNKVAIVTGAARGIGLEIANLFIAHGAKVIGLDLAFEENKSIDYKKCNISVFEECQTVFQEIVEKYNRIDILVNCAGITRVL